MFNFYYVNNYQTKCLYFFGLRTGREWGQDIYCYKKSNIIIKRVISDWAEGTEFKCFI